MVDSVRKDAAEDGGLSARLREFRESQGLDQKELAKRTDTAFRTYQDYEHGKSPPKVSFIQKLAALGCDLTWLLTGVRSVHASEDKVTVPVAPELMAAVVAMINRVYKQAGARLSDADLGRLAIEKYAEIIRASEEPDDYPAQTELAGNRLRRLLNEAAPGSGKRSA